MTREKELRVPCPSLLKLLVLTCNSNIPSSSGTLDLAAERHQHQADAPNLHPRSGGHDPAGRPERGRDSPQLAHQIQREAHICECH